LPSLDSALASGHAPAVTDERERELGALALELRAGAPEPSREFVAQLDERVASHFADATDNGASTVPGRNRGRRPATVGMPRRQAAGALATVLLALLVGGGLLAGAGGLGGGDVSTTTEDGRGSTAPGSGAEPLVTRPGTDSPSTEPTPVSPESPTGTDGFAPGERGRRVERTASLTLAAPEERLDRVADGVVAVTDRHRGHVVSSSTFSGEDQPAGGTFDLRVPTGELNATLSPTSPCSAACARRRRRATT